MPGHADNSPSGLDTLRSEIDGIDAELLPLFVRRMQTTFRVADCKLADGTPVIALTADAIVGAKDSYIREGFTDYLSKPIDPVVLEEMMLAYLPKEKTDGQSVSSALDALSDQNAIDVETGLRRCGDPEIYLEVLKSYYNSMVETASSLNAFLEKNDLKNYGIKIHALKSSSRTVGADEAGEWAAAL